MSGTARTNSESLLIAALARGCSQSEAARAAGISDRTVRRRLQDKAFRGKVREARREMLMTTVGALSDAGSAAVRALRQLLTAESDSVRLGAAKAILDHLPTRSMLEELGKLPQETEIRIVVPDWRKSFREAYEAGALRSASREHEEKVEVGTTPPVESP